jgi:porin
LQYAWHNKKGDPGLAGSIKLGGWQNFGRYDDLRYASNGVSFASPLAATQPAMLRGDSGIWAIAEQRS